MKIKVCHLYPDLLNLYGDRGNVLAFVQRCRWRGWRVEVTEINLGDPVNFADMDFLFIGGGSDREQNLIAADMSKRVENLNQAIENKLVVLAICGGYQLLGKYYRTPEGKEIPGLGLLDIYTVAGAARLIGNVAVEAELAGKKTMLVGFENHGGKTFINQTMPLGKVVSGNGNNGIDGTEGARHNNVFCSYLHGPLLPKNPALTDYLITLALERKGYDGELTELDDYLEERANEAMVKRLLG